MLMLVLMLMLILKKKRNKIVLDVVYNIPEFVNDSVVVVVVWVVWLNKGVLAVWIYASRSKQKTMDTILTIYNIASFTVDTKAETNVTTLVNST